MMTHDNGLYLATLYI